MPQDWVILASKGPYFTLDDRAKIDALAADIRAEVDDCDLDELCETQDRADAAEAELAAYDEAIKTGVSRWRALNAKGKAADSMERQIKHLSRALADLEDAKQTKAQLAAKAHAVRVRLHDIIKEYNERTATND